MERKSTLNSGCCYGAHSFEFLRKKYRVLCVTAAPDNLK
jgi:hypothetical protein